jgi:hypothetical protein
VPEDDVATPKPAAHPEHPAHSEPVELDQGPEPDVHDEQESAAAIDGVDDADVAAIVGETSTEAEAEAEPSSSAAAEASTTDAPSDSVEASDPASAAPEDRDGTVGSFERLSAVPYPVESNDQTVAGNVHAPTTTSNEAGATPDLSVLAPPPMSQHRVELPIAPPTPLASLASADEDIEDTRIVERSISGTRFVLQFSTGDSVIVTGTGLVGRNPIPEPSEKFDISVPITDPSKSVSKTHLEFGQMAGAFWISDRYSGNGTVVREPGGDATG